MNVHMNEVTKLSICSVLPCQARLAVAAYLKSKHVLPFGFARHKQGEASEREWNGCEMMGLGVHRMESGQGLPAGLLCKAKMQYALTLQVSRYCYLALKKSLVFPATSRKALSLKISPTPVESMLV